MTAAELRLARKYLEKTRPEMAALVGRSYRSYQNWELGITPVPSPVSLLVARLVSEEKARVGEIAEKVTKGFGG